MCFCFWQWVLLFKPCACVDFMEWCTNTCPHTHTYKSWLVVVGFKKCDARPHNSYAWTNIQSWCANTQYLSAEVFWPVVNPWTSTVCMNLCLLQPWPKHTSIKPIPSIILMPWLCYSLVFILFLDLFSRYILYNGAQFEMAILWHSYKINVDYFRLHGIKSTKLHMKNWRRLKTVGL